MTKPPLAVAVLISGTGSNLKALIDAKNAGQLRLEICLVISNKETAPGLDHARLDNIPFRVITSGNCDDQDAAIANCLLEHRAELIILAGYMRIVGELLVNTFIGRMINLHPSLLPSYPGLNTYQQVIDAGDSEHGASIHFVSNILDGGPVISQVRIPVLDGDNPTTLATRLAPTEHRLLVATVELFMQRRVEINSHGVQLDGTILTQPLQLVSGNTFD
ncbi:MAG: phosphoribosylglycinamide formyltransferase-1 [Lysobacterales bacterium]|jgi:phosphoribosylglycinamide formyltransferase-1